MSCEITPKIKDKQGNWIPSKLFVELNVNYGYDKALEIYKGIHSDSFIDVFGDWINYSEGLEINIDGEPTLEAIKSFYKLPTNDSFGSLLGFTAAKTKGQKQAQEELSPLEKAKSKLEAELTELSRLDVKGKNRDRIKQVSKVVDELNDQQTLIPLLNFAEDQVGPMVAKLAVLSTNDTSAYTYAELNDIIKRRDLFLSALTPEEFKTNNPDLVKRRDLLAGTVKNMTGKILSLVEAKIVDAAAQDFNPQLLAKVINLVDKTIGPSKNTSLVERFTLDSSKAADFINKVADFYVLRTENEINQELQNRTARVTKAYEAILAAKRKPEEIYEMMYEKLVNKKGETYYSGKYINKYAGEYNALLSFRQSAIKTKSKKVRIEYLRRWTEGMNIKPIDRTKYLAEEANQTLILNAQELVAWQSVHDPEIYKQYYDAFKAGDRTDATINGLLAFDQTIEADGKAYFSFIPSENLIDPQWKAIQADSLAREFYDAYKEVDTKSSNDLPSRFLDGKLIPSNYIFELKKSLYEEMVSDPLSRVLTTKARLAFLGSITENDNQENYVYKNPYTGESEYGLFVRNQRNLPLDFKSKNLYNIAITKAALASEFKRKSELEPLLLLLRELSKDKQIKNIKGELITNPNNNNVAMLDFRLKKTLYGKGNITEGGKLNLKIYKDEDLATAAQLEKQIAEKKEQKELAITQNKSQTTLDKFDKEIEELNDSLFKLGNMISYRQVVDTVSDYTRIKGLALNAVSATTDVLFGFISLSTEGTRYGISPLVAANSYRIAQQSLVTRTLKGEDKVKRFANLFDVESKLNEYKFNSKVAGKKNAIDTVVNSDNFFLMQTISGKINAYATMIAVLKTNKVPGTDTYIFDAFDKDGNWLLDIPNPYEVKYDEAGNFIPNKDVTKMSLLINDTTASIHGNYDTKKPIEGKKEWYGRAAFVFKSWLPNSLQNRIGRQQIDLLSNREIKGRYRSIFNKGGFFRREDGKFVGGRIIKNGLSLVGYGTSDMNELDFQNMRVNLFEVIAASFMLGLALMLKGLSGDDDDDDSMLLTYFVNQNNRIMKDLSFYYNPWGAKKMLDINTLMPVMGTIEDFGKLFIIAGRTLFDSNYDPNIKRGIDKGKNRLLTEGTDMVPGLFGVKRSIGFVKTAKKGASK